MTTPAIALANKPPLTRRWTVVRDAVIVLDEQTSAHAEMDPRAAGSFRLGRPNLRSRGDGPRACFCPTTRSAKPPLTRRWTGHAERAEVMAGQTSAHAEMDLDPFREGTAPSPNLRSRGDGPLRRPGKRNRRRKPPLTRRWTPASAREEKPASQTSAHAEMDPSSIVISYVKRTNLRSRGDGPTSCAATRSPVIKPPLTRRWTFLSILACYPGRQTSAHAEMDPRRRPYTARRRPNLRSRGDGPTRSTVSPDIKSKPPLTRRWTLDELRILGE